MHIVQIKCSK